MGAGRQESKGTTNLITPQKVQSAMKLVKSGIVVSLAHAEPQQVAADVGAARRVPSRRRNGITDGGTTDNYQVSYHGQTVAHIDTLVPLLRERPDVQRRARARTT